MEARVRAARDLHRFLGGEHVTRGPGVLGTALDDLRTVLGFDYGHINDWDSATGLPTVLALRDLPPDQQQLWEKHIQEEPTFVGITPDAPALRASDVPVSRRTTVLYEELFYPAQLADVLALRLWARDGRFVGSVIAYRGGRSPFDEIAVDLLEMLGPRLGAVLDPVPELWPLSTDLADGRAEGMIVDRAGHVRPLTAAADTVLAGPGGPLRPPIDAVANGRSPVHSLVLLVGDRVLSVSLHAGRHGVLVLHRTIPAPFGLSVRELQILDALACGATNTRLAARFGLAPRTVATYVERLLTKTGCPNRTAAARLAARLNLTVR